jgi:hypothetical protein
MRDHHVLGSTVYFTISQPSNTFSQRPRTSTAVWGDVACAAHLPSIDASTQHASFYAPGSRQDQGDAHSRAIEGLVLVMVFHWVRNQDVLGESSTRGRVIAMRSGWGRMGLPLNSRPHRVWPSRTPHAPRYHLSMSCALQLRCRCEKSAKVMTNMLYFGAHVTEASGMVLRK